MHMPDSMNVELSDAIQTAVRSILEEDTAVAGLTQPPGETITEKARNLVSFGANQLPKVTLEQTADTDWQLRITTGVFVRSYEPVPQTLDRLSAAISQRAAGIFAEVDSLGQLETTVTLVVVSVVTTAD